MYWVVGGADRDRTDDLRLAKPALSRLSYSPSCALVDRRSDTVGQGRVELPTSRLSGVRSNHLSYWPLWSRLLPRMATRDGVRTLKDQCLIPGNWLVRIVSSG